MIDVLKLKPGRYVDGDGDDNWEVLEDGSMLFAGTTEYDIRDERYGVLYALTTFGPFVPKEDTPKPTEFEHEGVTVTPHGSSLQVQRINSSLFVTLGADEVAALRAYFASEGE